MRTEICTKPVVVGVDASPHAARAALRAADEAVERGVPPAVWRSCPGWPVGVLALTNDGVNRHAGRLTLLSSVRAIDGIGGAV
jgi:hypothetical protein